MDDHIVKPRIHQGPRVHIEDPAKFINFQECIEYLEVKCRFEEMGIMCVQPPQSCAPPVFDLLNGGPDVWRHLENVVAIQEVHEQILRRPNPTEAPDLTLVTHSTHTMTLSFAEFGELAKVYGKYYPFARDPDEAMRIIFKQLKNVDYQKEGCANLPPIPGALYPFNIDGSIFKTMEGKHMVS